MKNWVNNKSANLFISKNKLQNGKDFRQGAVYGPDGSTILILWI
jgi:hypothetical protein